MQLNSIYLPWKTDLFNCELHTIKEASYNSALSGSNSEGTSQSKKLTTERINGMRDRNHTFKLFFSQSS